MKDRTSVVIAHRLSTITSADQIIVLNYHGEIGEMGKHEELFHANRLYKRFWESRQQARGWKVTRVSNAGIQQSYRRVSNEYMVK